MMPYDRNYLTTDMYYTLSKTVTFLSLSDHYILHEVFQKKSYAWL